MLPWHMRRQARRLSQKALRKLDRTKDAVTHFVTRSISDYHYPSSTQHTITSSAAIAISDTEDDLVFQGTEGDDSLTADGSGQATLMIPCEFCNLPQAGESLIRHQISCLQNPHAIGGRSNSSGASLRRVNSERPTTAPPAIPPRMPTSILLTPSAPPRSRSPSPTEGFPIPDRLKCPITLALFHDPVVASDGHTYERAAILSCLRTSRKSPMTRETISLDTLNPNLLIKQMAHEFRADCRRKRELYKYRLDVDVMKKEAMTNRQNRTRSIYAAEWMRIHRRVADMEIVLTHLTGTNAEQIGQVNCQLGPHPNIVRTFGRVEHPDAGILLVQEHVPEQTLANLLQSSDQKFSISILDAIFSQTIAAVQHLISSAIFPGTISAENIFIYQLDDMLENNLIKLNNLGSVNEIDRNSDDEATKEDEPGEKSHVFELGLLARDLYKLELATNEEDLSVRQSLFARCLETDPDVRPTLEELSTLVVDLMATKKFIFH